MIKVDFPALGGVDVYSVCLSSVGVNDNLYNRLKDVSLSVSFEWTLFIERTRPISFHSFVPCLSRDDAFKIAGQATKGDFKLLYNRYMVKGRKDSRAIYDKLRLASHSLCPLCGIGEATTLDHYLPKSRYPLLSVNPRNLVPACKDCNTNKSDPTYATVDKLPLYPYCDDSKFYNNDWIKASVWPDNAGLLKFDFFVCPPDDWSEVEKQRVINHFSYYGLKSKYNINARLHVIVTVGMIRMLLECGDGNSVRKFFIGLLNRERCNSTLRVVYKAIAADINICSGDF